MLTPSVKKLSNWSSGALCFAALAVTACGAVYPEVQTPARAPAAGARLLPEPPQDLLYVRFASAVIPETTRDGRKWDSVGGAAPDPFAKLFVRDTEVYRTPVQANTLKPTWPDGIGRNYRIPLRSPVRVEVWDSNAINNHPICVRDVNNIHEESHAGTLELVCDSGAKVTLIVEPAHAKVGLGLSYEFRTESVYVTRVPIESPAARVGLKPGDQIIRIQGKDVGGLDEAEARSAINSNAPTGVTLSVKRADGSTIDLTLKDGPIYPTIDDDIPFD
jgi:membrane-associated protease RseP (regulator of RpoE activity)